MLIGDVDNPVQPDLELVVEIVTTNSAPPVVMEAAEVTFADSTLINGIVRLRHECDEAGIRLIVAQPSPPVQRILQLTGFDDIVDP